MSADGATFECQHHVWCETCVECDKLDAARYKALEEKANNLARLVEQLALAPVAGYYEQLGNPAPLKLLRMAVEEVDALMAKGGAR
jgi:hypothetical protein